MKHMTLAGGAVIWNRIPEGGGGGVFNDTTAWACDPSKEWMVGDVGLTAGAAAELVAGKPLTLGAMPNCPICAVMLDQLLAERPA